MFSTHAPRIYTQMDSPIMKHTHVFKFTTSRGECFCLELSETVRINTKNSVGDSSNIYSFYASRNTWYILNTKSQILNKIFSGSLNYN